VVLTERNPALWYESSRRTIINPEIVRRNWLKPAQVDEKLASARARFSAAGARRGFPAGIGMDEGIRIYLAHNRAVRREAPPGSLLRFAVAEGWQPLCAFLGVPEPATAFPHLNTTGAYRDQYR